MLHSPRLLTAGLTLLAACSNPLDRAAKERIFSPEAPPAVVSSAKESLNPQKLASNPKLAHRVVDMGSAEVTERIGPHRFSAEVSFTWNSGKEAVKLTETRLLESAAGGVSGDFHARIENSRDQGLEVVRARGQVFARSKFGKYRLRLRDRGMAERTRDETAGALRELDTLFQGRLELALEGPTSVEGQSAFRYTVRLDATDGGGGPPPAVAYSRGGLNEDTARRQRFINQRQPKKLSGEVVVDAATAVVLRAHLDGLVATPGTRASPRHSCMWCSTSVSRTWERPSRSRPPKGTCRTPTSRRASPTPSTASASSERAVPTAGWTPRPTRTPPDRPGPPRVFGPPGHPPLEKLISGNRPLRYRKAAVLKRLL